MCLPHANCYYVRLKVKRVVGRSFRNANQGIAVVGPTIALPGRETDGKSGGPAGDDEGGRRRD
jgi:hypothetical protein